ncbi:MAG TPA: CAP domain-containing protein [Methanoregula sp.]|nr:CAP domain-containing protein [Methanoregula sp.]
MVNSSCPSCSAAVPDPAGDPGPSCGSIRAGTMQDRPVTPGAGPRRGMPAVTVAAALLLLLAAAATVVLFFVLYPGPVPGAAHGGILPAPSTVPADADVAPSYPRLPGPDNTNSESDPDPAIDTATTPALPGASAAAGPEGTISQTQPYSFDASVKGSGPEIPPFSATLLEARVHEQVNRVRQENGLAALGTDAALVSLARAHSADMAKNMYFGHVDLNGLDATARGAAAGYACHRNGDPVYTYAVAENLFAAYRYRSVLFLDGRLIEPERVDEQALAEEAVDAWMNSPDHRANLLDPGVNREGIGVAVLNDTLVFVTENLC